MKVVYEELERNLALISKRLERQERLKYAAARAKALVAERRAIIESFVKEIMVMPGDALMR